MLRLRSASLIFVPLICGNKKPGRGSHDRARNGYARPYSVRMVSTCAGPLFMPQ